jgi:hypothetical protein
VQRVELVLDLAFDDGFGGLRSLSHSILPVWRKSIHNPPIGGQAWTGGSR